MHNTMNTSLYFKNYIQWYLINIHATFSPKLKTILICFKIQLENLVVLTY